MSIELAKSFLNDSRMCDRDQYTDDYTSTFPGDVVMPVDMVCPTVQAFVAAAPDFNFNVKNWRLEGETVTCEATVTATMTNDFSHPQFGDISATGRKATLPVERLTLTFRNGKVASMLIDSDGPSGPPEVIRQWST